MHFMFTKLVYEDLSSTTVFLWVPNMFSFLNRMAAIVIQSYWRGYIVRRPIHFSTRLHTAAAVGPLASQPNFNVIKNKTILKKEKRENTVTIQEQRKKAAILIQVSCNLVVK